MLTEMDPLTQLKALVQSCIRDFLHEKREHALEIGQELSHLFDEADAFLRGGKRFRATCLALGYLSHAPLDFDGDARTAQRVTYAATALEFFHAAALVHDDIIDRSATRRGRPSVHSSFTELHIAQKLRGSSGHFGLSMAILLGDLLQSWADELFQRALDITDDHESRASAREQFNTMRTEVTYGQYFDVFEEQHAGFADHDTQLSRSTRVLLYKSAKYSVEAPLLLGATLAGGGPALLQTLTEFGVPVGVAFQLRDDILGVFGDSQETGKPSGDDLRSGKRTVLVTLAREKLPASAQRLFDEMLGTDLDHDQVEMLQRTIRDSGALQQVEQMIERNVSRASELARSTEVSAAASDSLARLAHKMAHRST